MRSHGETPSPKGVPEPNKRAFHTTLNRHAWGWDIRVPPEYPRFGGLFGSRFDLAAWRFCRHGYTTKLVLWMQKLGLTREPEHDRNAAQHV